MPDQRHHRGPHPQDDALFAVAAVPALRSAVGHLAWLLTREYAWNSALKLVGDRFSLQQRQRLAVMRSACSDQALEHRRSTRCAPDALRGETVFLDGFNVLTTVEAALSGGVILIGRDGSYRDLASMHGSYRKVEESVPAAELIGRTLGELGATSAVWYLDQPVSNSGRLKGVLLETAGRNGWDWRVDVVPSPDRVLSESGGIVVTADSAILDRCGRWFPVAREVVVRCVQEAWVVDLGG